MRCICPYVMSQVGVGLPWSASPGASQGRAGHCSLHWTQGRCWCGLRMAWTHKPSGPVPLTSGMADRCAGGAAGAVVCGVQRGIDQQHRMQTAGVTASHYHSQGCCEHVSAHVCIASTLLSGTDAWVWSHGCAFCISGDQIRSWWVCRCAGG